MKVCRICLSKDGRLYPINSNGLRSLYHQLTGILKLEIDIDMRLPQWVCAECGLRLISFNKLRQKSLRSYGILTELLNTVTCITEEDVNKIDRHKNSLQSSLSFGLIHHDIIYEYEIDDSEPDEYNWKPKVKVEYIKDIDVSLIKPEKGDPIKGNMDHSYTAVSNEGNNLANDSDSDKADDNSNEDNGGLFTEYLKFKTINKPKQLDTKKRDDYFNKSLNKKSDKKVKDSTVIDKDPDPIEDIFVVQKLTLDEQNAELEKRKHSRNYTSAMFKCSDCFRGFNTEITFARHKLMHTDEWGKIEYKLCKRRFRTMHTYCRHMTSHKTLYTCKECGFSANLKSTALQHVLNHRGKIYKCTQCGLDFKHRSSYMSHLRIKHVSNFVCELCGFSFLSAQGVEQHKAIKHVHEKDATVALTDCPTCAKCKIKFVSDKALNTHLRVFHSRNTDVKKRNDDTGAYENTRTACELCGVNTPDGRAYSFHLRRFHPNHNAINSTKPKPFICEQCGRGFKKKCNLLSHRLVHSGDKPYECDTCHMTFKSKNYLQNHIVNVHLPKVPKIFYCDICGKAFNNPSNRLRHMKYIHSGLRPFICEICGSSFKTKGDLKAHTAHVHLKKAWPRKKEKGEFSEPGQEASYVAIKM